jgi:hypothetical protein
MDTKDTKETKSKKDRPCTGILSFPGYDRCKTIRFVKEFPL